MNSTVQTPKRAANVSIDSELLHKAKALKINLSATLESALKEMVDARERELWKKQNKAAIETYNRMVEEQGSFGDGVRSF